MGQGYPQQMHIITKLRMESYLGEDEWLPSLKDNAKAIAMYMKLKTVENPSQILRAERWGMHTANIAHTKPAMAIQYGSFI